MSEVMKEQRPIIIESSVDPVGNEAYFADMLPPKPRWSERHPMLARLGKVTGKYVGLPIAAGSLMVGAIQSCDIGIDDINPNPGQEEGAFKIDEAVVSNFAAESSDAVGSADITVKEVTQEYIDKRDDPSDEPRVHETLVFNNGKYRGHWIVKGSWQPEMISDELLEVTLPSVEGYDLATIKDPEINKDETSRAFWQSAAGVFGAADTRSDDAFRNTRNALREWISDPDKSGDFQESLACVALAGAAQKSDAILGVASNKVNVEQYVPPRADEPVHIAGAPTIRFQIEDPKNPGEMLDIESCLPVLDNLGYSNKDMSTEPGSRFGLSDQIIPEITLRPVEQ